MIGIFGGTFDPVHYGHLRTALELSQQLNFKEIRFIPCQKPVFDKTPKASPEQRLAMLKLAISQQDHFIADERELKRTTPSFMIDTLISLRNDFKQTPLGLIIGSDALAELDKWHRWEELIAHAHLIVIPRPNYVLSANKIIAAFMQKHNVTDPKLLHQQSNGYLYIANVTPLAISATAIRNQIANGLNSRYLLPDSVLNYIQQEKLYL